MAKGQIKQKQATINQNTFESLCAIQCTKEEICSVLDVSEKTLNSWCNNTYGENFSLVFNKKKEFGKSSLRRTQWRLAEKNPTMALWLGKQYLNQKDNIEVAHTDMSKVDELLSEIKNISKTDYVNNDESVENTENLKNEDEN